MTFKKLFATSALTILSVGALIACGNGTKTINVCASEVPHAEVLNSSAVKAALKDKGYNLKVTVLDWTIQNDSVANGDYDANYFQHVPYLETYQGKVELFAAAKVHYEPLGIYYGKAAKGTAVTDGKSFEICNDSSNAVRALQLLNAKGVIAVAEEGENAPYTADGELTAAVKNNKWTSKDGVEVTLIAEELLAQSKNDYDFACLPCNTAYTAKIAADQRAAVEDDPAQVAGKANIIAARKADYASNEVYKAKIDALCDVMLSKTVSDFFAEKYLGAMTCDASTQIDLRK
ncbi:MAG: MetQ/NlpA family ABC transporter substrate-binding protein [Bacilli bacterium]|nr:MetQ/NlpA family ABC transporter substrate-binding protein [Bacilli bacterium]